jgi:hypothetical protein
MKRSRFGRLPVFLFAAFVSTASGSAWAAPGDAAGESATQKKVAVGGFSGPKSGQVRGWVLKVLKNAGEYEVTDAGDVKGGGDSKAYSSAAKGLGVDAIVTGKVSGDSDLVLTVHNAADGSALGDVEIKGGSHKKLQKAIDNELAIAIADPLAQSKAAGAAEAAAAAEEPEDEAPSEEPEEAEEEPSGPAPDDGASSPSPLEIMVGMRAYNRNFSYVDPVQDLYPEIAFEDPLYTYELPLGPALLVDLRFYPGAFFAEGIAANIGIAAHFEQGFATRSVYAENTPEETELETASQELLAGLIWRIPIDKHEIGLMAQYGIHKFRLNGDEIGTEGTGAVTDDFPLVPDTDYRMIRIGADARFRFGEFMVGVHAAPRILLSLGELGGAAWFPGAKGMGVDAGLMLGYSIIPSLDVVAGFDYIRYGFDFNAIPTNNLVVAGGAVDTYISGYLGVLFRLPGNLTGGGGSASASIGGE